MANDILHALHPNIITIAEDVSNLVLFVLLELSHSLMLVGQIWSCNLNIMPCSIHMNMKLSALFTYPIER